VDQFLLVLLPGVLVFLAGLLYGLVYIIRYRQPNLRAAQLRLYGLALMLGLPSIWLTYLVLAGRASIVALLGNLGLLPLEHPVRRWRPFSKVAFSNS
jgi:hypothetical protein